MIADIVLTMKSETILFIGGFTLGALGGAVSAFVSEYLYARKRAGK